MLRAWVPVLAALALCPLAAWFAPGARVVIATGNHFWLDAAAGAAIAGIALRVTA